MPYVVPVLSAFAFRHLQNSHGHTDNIGAHLLVFCGQAKQNIFIVSEDFSPMLLFVTLVPFVDSNCLFL